MRRAPIIEDWSRFNRAVLEIADGNPEPALQKQTAPQKQNAQQQPKRDPTERVSEPGDHGDISGLIARHAWRKHA